MKPSFYVEMCKDMHRGHLELSNSDYLDFNK